MENIDKVVTSTEPENIQEEGLYIFFKSEDVVKVLLQTDYGKTINIFGFGIDFKISDLVPFVYSSFRTEFGLEYVVCIVPEGRNFFEEDFTELNEALFGRKEKGFVFNL